MTNPDMKRVKNALGVSENSIQEVIMSCSRYKSLGQEDVSKEALLMRAKKILKDIQSMRQDIERAETLQRQAKRRAQNKEERK
jgi:hypothetical protein